ncbi:hypothetical protein [Chryseobacterium vrystaatense]|nr:hypothetical protein [Chryseobacterium vrystaatense]
MKKQLFLSAGAVCLSMTLHAQFGVNTNFPAATLDVTATAETGTSSVVDGALIPRVDRQRAQSMKGVPVSTLIYINNIATGTAAGAAIHIDAIGFYYYNGTSWIKLIPPSANTNLYNSNGTLDDNRVVAQGTKTLAFTGTAANAFSVDGATFSVDAANDRVGMGTVSPSRKLHVEGGQFLNAAKEDTGRDATTNAIDINIGQDGYGYGNRWNNYGINIKSSSSVHTGNVARINFGDTSTSTAGGERYLSFSVGKSLKELMFLESANDGRVGIGTAAPETRLDINTPTKSYGLQHTDGTVKLRSYLGKRISNGGTDAAWLGTYSNHPLDLMTNDTAKMRIDTNGNVGIGTDSATEKLDIDSGNVRIRSINTKLGSAGMDRIVVVDANGVLKTIGAGSEDSGLFYARLGQNKNVFGVPVTLLFSELAAASALYSYNTSTGILTFKQAGSYQINMQASFAQPSVNLMRYVLGIKTSSQSNADGNYIARASKFSSRPILANDHNPTIGDLMTFTTAIKVPYSGYSIKFVAASTRGDSSGPATAVILSTESGTSGDGNVTNISIQKIK